MGAPAGSACRILPRVRLTTPGKIYKPRPRATRDASAAIRDRIPKARADFTFDRTRCEAAATFGRAVWHGRCFTLFSSAAVPRNGRPRIGATSRDGEPSPKASHPPNATRTDDDRPGLFPQGPAGGERFPPLSDPFRRHVRTPVPRHPSPRHRLPPRRAALFFGRSRRYGRRARADAAGLAAPSCSSPDRSRHHASSRNATPNPASAAHAVADDRQPAARGWRAAASRRPAPRRAA